MRILLPGEAEQAGLQQPGQSMLLLRLGFGRGKTGRRITVSHPTPFVPLAKSGRNTTASLVAEGGGQVAGGRERAILFPHHSPARG